MFTRIKYAVPMTQWTCCWAALFLTCKFIVFRRHSADFSNRQGWHSIGYVDHTGGRSHRRYRLSSIGVLHHTPYDGSTHSRVSDCGWLPGPHAAINWICFFFLTNQNNQKLLGETRPPTLPPAWCLSSTRWRPSTTASSPSKRAGARCSTTSAKDLAIEEAHHSTSVHEYKAA